MGSSEVEEPRRVGVVSMEVHGAGAREVEERCWAADMALIAGRRRDPNHARFNRALGH